MSNLDVLSELSKDILKKGNSIRFQAKGWSMHPFIQDGDFIEVSPIQNSPLKRGDIVFYSTTGNKIIVHRVIKKYKKDSRGTVLIRGDASFGPSEEVDIKNVLGKLVSVQRDGQRISLDEGSARLIGFLYSRLWPLMKIPKVFAWILSLLDSNLFIKKPIDSFQSVAEKYNSREEVEYHSQLTSEGLEEWEKSIVKLMKPEARILDVGCGTGREAIALAKMGFDVTGIDISTNMITKAIGNAKKEELNIDFRAQSVVDITFPAKSFDYVLFSRAVYSYIPTKKLRVKMLKKIRDILKPDGMLFFTAYYKDKRIFSRLNIMGFFRRIRNFFFKEKFESEPGDIMVRYVSPASTPKRLCFCHFFSGPKEISEEIGAAELTVAEVKDDFIWIVKP